MAVTLTVNADHTASLSNRYLARQGEVGALMTVTVPPAVYALGTYAYIDFIDADGVASYLGEYDASSGSFVVSIGAADNTLAKDGIVKIQFVLRDNLISESYAAVWKSQMVEAIVDRSVNADTYAVPMAMPSVDPPDTYEASRVSIADVGNYYSSANAEDALQEIGNRIAQNAADIVTAEGRLDDIEAVTGIVKGNGAGTYSAATEADIPRAGGATYPFAAMPYAGTAPIVERGSNANGQYIKFADGSMICSHTLALGTIKAAGTGTWDDPFRTAEADWTFPVAFNSNPTVTVTGYVNASVSARKRYLAYYQNVSTTAVTAVNILRIGSDASNTNGNAALIAVGAWK